MAPLRYALHAILLAVLAIVLVVSVDRLLRWHPYAKRFRNFDAYVKSYAGAQTLTDLSEPGDSIVHAPYGGWELFTARRANGISPAFLFNDFKMFPPEMWRRFVGEVRVHAPTLMQFTEKPLEQRFFSFDPTLKDRDFWNGVDAGSARTPRSRSTPSPPRTRLAPTSSTSRRPARSSTRRTRARRSSAAYAARACSSPAAARRSSATSRPTARSPGRCAGAPSC